MSDVNVPNSQLEGELPRKEAFSSESESSEEMSTSDQSDSSLNDRDESEADTESDDEYQEEWAEFDRNEFIAELLKRDNMQRENMSKLPIQDGSKNGKFMNLITWLFYFLHLWKCVNVISDNALNTLLYFLYNLFELMSLQDQLIAAALHVIPASVYTLRKFLLVDRDSFERYIVCPQCTKLYKHDECFNDGDTIPHLLRCNNVLKRSKRRTTYCNQMMFRKVILKGGDEAYYQLKTFSYRPLIESLENILCRTGYEDMCEQWRTRETIPGHAYDIYDGEIWKSFQNINGRGFLSEKSSYCLQLNIDWFQPFSRRKGITVGVIYMCLLNLPFSLRYKRENIFILGIIPALDKEPSTLNFFLEPLVKELKYLWKGVRIATSNQPNGTNVRAALLCCTADVPALRKLCGFLGHSANLGCSKCLKSFPGGFGEKNDYSGFDRDLWPKRSYRDHLRAIKKIEKCKSKTAKQNQERTLGWRFTPLTELDYFDSVLHHVIDPMHNLFLGTAKRIFKYWVNEDILTNEKLKLIDSKIRDFKISGDFGRLPSNISANWGGFTAEQWKTWTLVYSSYALHGLISEADFKIWHTFVTACRKLIAPVISYEDARVADLLFVKFGKEVERTYGKHIVTPNMHLHCHLYESVKQFGPVFAFWLFSFERFNGMLESFNTNERENFEIQLMREFVVTSDLLGRSYMSTNDEHSKVLLPIAESLSGSRRSPNTTNIAIKSWKLSMLPTHRIDDWSDLSVVNLPAKKRLVQLDNDEFGLLQEVYKFMYSNAGIKNMALTISKYKSIHVNGQVYTTKSDFRGNYARIFARWIDDKGEIDPFSTHPRPGTVKCYFTHTAEINGLRKHHCFACIDWHQLYPYEIQYANPVSVWYKSRYFRGTSAIFMPVQRIYARFAGVEKTDKSSGILITCPLYKRIQDVC